MFLCIEQMMASLSSPDHEACDFKKILRVYERRRRGGNWAMVIHFKGSLFSFLIVAALFTSVVDGQHVPFEPEGKEKTTFAIMVGTVVAGIAVFAVIGVAVTWKYKKKPAKGDLAQPGTVVHHSVEAHAHAAPAKVGSRTAYRTTPVAAAAHQFTYSEILSIIGNFGMVVHYSMEAQAAPGKAGIETFLKETTFAAEESGSHAACEVSSTRMADRTTPVTAAAPHFTCNEILRIVGNFGMVVQHSMEVQAAPTKADSRTAMEKTASAAKESGRNAAREVSSTKTTDETKPAAAAASPFTENEILRFTGKFVNGTVVQHSLEAQAMPTKGGTRTATEETTCAAKESGSHAANEVSSTRRADRTTPVAAAASTFTDKEILSITGNFGTEVQKSLEAQGAPTKAGSRTATEKISTAKDSGSNAASEVSSAITADRMMLVAGAANPLPDNEILSITGNFGLQHSMEAQAAPSKAGSRTATEEKTSAAEESGSVSASQVSNTRIADRTTPVAAAASPFTDNKLLSITGNLGMVVQHSMEAQAAPSKAGSRTAMEKTASAAKESGRNTAGEVSSTKTDDETKPVVAAASPFTDNEILSFTGKFAEGTVVQHSIEAQAPPTKAGSGTATEKTTFTVKVSESNVASKVLSSRRADRTTPVAAAASTFTDKEILSITGNIGKEVQHSMEAHAAPTKASSRTATQKTTSTAKDSASNAASEVSSNITADITMLVAAAASPLPDNEIPGITEDFVVQHSMEAQAAPSKAGSRTATEKNTSAAEESGSLAACQMSNIGIAERTTPAAASAITHNKLWRIFGNLAKKSGRHAASERSSTRPTENMALVTEATRRFTYDEILSITRSFSQVIGEGGFSTVYYGQLPDSLKVAVKKLKESGLLPGNLLTMIKILTRIHHKNLVSLVGLCEEQDEIILVYEYMAGGSLSQILKDRNKELTWRKRLQIALDAATGLEYLHTGCRPAIIHRDIKPANILLDETLQAKLADSVLFRAGAVDGTEHSDYQTIVAGTMGYIDPEYLYTQTLSKKSDVYSFGVVLLQLITGKTAIMINETNENCLLSNWVVPMLMRGKMESLLDPLLKGRCNIQSVWEVAAIAKTAIQDPAGRPDMPKIVSTLKAALSMETSWLDMASVSEMMTSQTSFDGSPHNPVAAAASPFTGNFEWHAVSEVSSARTANRTTLVLEAASRFTYNEILSITDNFGRVIGQGGSSTVYYGQLSENSVKVAVKKLNKSGSQIGNLLKEIMILTRIQHKNLVSLVGFCVEKDEKILVSEYMANGSLHEILKARANELTWRKRLQIALDAAIGLEYLHTGCKPSVIHRDIKPSNILLDENLHAKLTDFELSKAGAVDGTEQSAYQTIIAGTIGYIDPEYVRTGTLTKKSDVYSFGVVLFELITGKPAMMITETNEKCHLSNWVVPMLMRGEIESLLDPLLKGRCNIQSVWKVAAIAKTAQDPAGRPDMPKIVSTLKAALSMETSWVDTTSESSFC